MSVLRNLVEDLERLRDEVHLKINLGGLEAREEWEKLEAKWSTFASEARLHEAGDNIGSVIHDLGEELKTSYRNLRSALKK